MKEIPAKLEKYLSILDDNNRKEKLQLFLSVYDKAKKADMQNARHWAMRQVLSERSINEIEKRFDKLLKKQKVPQ